MTGLVLLGVVGVVAAGVFAAAGAMIFTTPKAAVVCFIIAMAALTVFISFNWATTYRNEQWVTCEVTGKSRAGGTYYVYTSNCGQLLNRDSLLRFKFNSTDIWQEIPLQGRVKIRIAGSRNSYFSLFPNILEAHRVIS